MNLESPEVRTTLDRMMKLVGDAKPICSQLAAIVERTNHESRKLVEMTLAIPEPGRRQLSAVRDRVPRFFSKWILGEFSKVFGGANLPFIEVGEGRSPEDFFRDLGRAVETVRATAAGGGSGRRMFRCISNISGISGGLMAKHGDVLCLVEKDPEVVRMLNAGVLVPAASGERTAVA
jgi:hypothetical protein